LEGCLITQVVTEQAQRSGAATLDASSRAFYAAGGVAPAIVLTLTGGFVLLYYSNALGAPAALVGAALAAALVFDALWDPLVGYISDNTRSPWGRRHPYMYLAIAPVTFLCWAVWHPPSFLDPTHLPLYLLLTIIPLRLSVALFDVPSNALTAELSSDYDERTRLATYRTCTSWLFITAFSAALYGYWLRPTPDYPNGLLNPEGYRQMGYVAAGVVCLTMLVCAVGLHRMIPALPKAAAGQRLSLADLWGSVVGSFGEPVLRPLLATSAAISTGFAIYSALFPYQFGYFWRLSSAELSMTTIPWALALLVGYLATPLLRRFAEKRILAIVGIVALALSVGAPVLLALIGVLPGEGSSARFLIMCGFLFCDMIAYLMITASLASMLADAVEHRELLRGRREEGTIFAAQTLILKISTAFGVLIAGILLQLIGFPEGGGDVADGVTQRLALVWVLGNAGFYALGAASLAFYRLTRKQHTENVARLKSLEEAKLQSPPSHLLPDE